MDEKDQRLQELEGRVAANAMRFYYFAISSFNFNSLISNFTNHMFDFSFVQIQSTASNDVVNEQSPQSHGWGVYANEQTPPSGWGNRNGSFDW
jgi:hypothetical protein